MKKLLKACFTRGKTGSWHILTSIITTGQANCLPQPGNPNYNLICLY